MPELRLRSAGAVPDDAPVVLVPAFDAPVGSVSTTSAGRDGPRVVAVGLGDRDTCDPRRLRVASMTAGRMLAAEPEVATTLPSVLGDTTAAILSVAEGFSVGRYRYRGGVGAELTLCLSSDIGGEPDAPEVTRALEIAGVAADAVEWVRRMVDTPPSDLTPAVFAERIAQRASAAGVKCEIWSGDRLVGAGFGGTLGVGRGSARPPCVVHLWTGAQASDPAPVLGLAGKGITFDAGGINLKRDPDEIAWMKSDMAAAAAVVAAVCAAARLGSMRSVHAVLPLAENLPGPGSLLPGDVVIHPDGSSTEVLDTDNEGRLVLADAISFLVDEGVDSVIDVGTLTDGGGVGHLLWGCWGTSDRLIAEILAAGDRVGDAGWHLPLREEYAELFTSPVADRANRARDVPDIGLTAATFLSSFPRDVPWAHIDNGGTAYLDADLPPWAAGPTGSPTRALLELLLEPDATVYTQ